MPNQPKTIPQCDIAEGPVKIPIPTKTLHKLKKAWDEADVPRVVATDIFEEMLSFAPAKNENPVLLLNMSCPWVPPITSEP